MKTFLLSLALGLSAISFGQINKNSILLGGQFSFYGNSQSNGSIKDSKLNTQAINLALGKAIDTNKVVGVKTSYSHWKNFYPAIGDSLSSHNNAFGAGIFFRQYFRLANRFYIFGESELSGYYSNQVSNELSISNTLSSKTGTITASITTGLSYSLFKKLNAELALPNLLQMSYFHSQLYNSNMGNYKQSGYNLSSSVMNFSNLGQQLRLGFSFIL